MTFLSTRCVGAGCFLEAFFSILYGLSRTPLQAAAAFGLIDIAAQLHGSGGACSLSLCTKWSGGKNAFRHKFRRPFLPSEICQGSSDFSVLCTPEPIGHPEKAL